MEALSAAAIATLLITKMVEKLGESLGEKIPELGSKVWDKVSDLKNALKRQAPETAAVLEAAENAPTLIESNPDTFGLPVLTEQMQQSADKEPEVAASIDALVTEVKPLLPASFQEKVVQQVMLKGVKSKSLRAKDLSQDADPAATHTTQEMAVDVEVEGDINLENMNQNA